ncbi:NAD(P)/FAD-dependent oxidoreductase [Actinoplanes sp. NPDC049265]|uniref:NAD(P)/FAD-dependent oxidoreductase n=1 Tax=Actinoplanes sp. NPDC049265 TaxID=3363902 RepID=UPI0037126CDC
MIVVGAGIAGLACARELIDAGIPARVVERGRVVGGRLASTRFDGRYADIGAAYLTADDPAFQGLLDSWRVAGLAHPWTDTFAVSAPEGDDTTTGPMRWSAPGGLRSLAEDLARELDVTLEQEVRALPEADAVVLAMPAPQAMRVTPVGVPQEWSPVLAAVLTFGERSWADFHGMFVNGHPVLATVCDDGDRRGDRAPVLVAHSTGDFARPRLGDPLAAAGDLESAVRKLLDLPPAESVRVHRWTYAQPLAGDAPFHRQGNVYVCGDAFGKPRVQTAWLSGRAVARDIVLRRRSG